MKGTQKIGLTLGPILFILILLLPIPQGMQPDAMKVLAVAVFMATWWFTEAIPIPATSLMPLVLFPGLGIMSSKAASAPYANHLIYLFLGGFFLALAMQKWNLHRRIALQTIRIVGTSPKRIIFGFMFASSGLSMAISNTATAMMMMPIALAVVTQAAEIIKEQKVEGIDPTPTKFHFGTAMMLGIAYACSVGGVGTIIGSPPNAILVGMLESNYHVQISFAEWMLMGWPLAMFMMVVTWYYLVTFAFKIEIKELPGGKDLILKELKEMGPISAPELRVLLIFGLVATGWIVRGFIEWEAIKMVHDSTIAMAGAVALFAVPADLKQGKFLMDWETAVTIPWGVILLFGGGLSLAGAFKKSGLAIWIGEQLSGLSGLPLFAVILIVILIAIFLTEFTSNTATASMLLPVLASTAVAMAIHPYGLVMGAGIAVSFAFMLPIATPPNAVVFGSNHVTIPQMAKAGFAMNIIGAIVVSLFIYFLLPHIWDFNLAELPQWATPKPK